MTTDFLKDFTPGYGPGRRWHYSNQGFALLGALVSYAYTGAKTPPDDWDGTYQSWPTVVRDMILESLAMDSSQVGYNGGDMTKLAQSFNCKPPGGAYTAEPTPDIVMDSAALGAGALTSTLTDMLTFLDSQISPLQGSLYEAIALTQKPAGDGLSMGLGWQIGNGYFEKNGLVVGYASYMAFDPTSGYGIFAMANSWGGDDGGLLCNTARKALGDLRGSPTKPPQFPTPPACLKPGCPTQSA
jgi:beta-lactamase class C